YFPRAMRLLLLALPVLAFLPEVIPAYSGEKKCLNRSGHCRKNCKDGKVIQEACKNHRICCVPDTKGYSQEASNNQVTKSVPTIVYDLSSDFMDMLQ
uniref:Defensin beta 21 n=1 Tax=Nannospalax galili TaxID=1026970 RepID=A0A8C6QH24_NANGA